MIKIENLNFKYHNNTIFKDFNLNIKANNITTILGLNGSGKTTLIKILTGLLEFDGNITIDNIELNKKNIKNIRKIMGVVFENPNDQLLKETIYDDLKFVLKNMDIEEIDEKISNISKKLKIEDILNKDYKELNTNQKQLANLAVALVHEPKILILDEAFNYIDAYQKDEILSILKKLKKTTSIIIVSHDIEDILISDNIIVLDKSGIVLAGKKDEVIKEEKKLNDLGFKLPFMVELSNRLMFYGLIDHVIFDMEEMVNTLWP